MWFFIHNLDGFLWTSVTLLCPSLCSGAKPRRPSVSGVCCIPSWTLRKSPHLKMRDTNQIKSQIQGGNECRNVSQCVAYGYERRPFRDLPWTYPGPVRDLSTEDTKLWQGQSLKLSLMDHDVQRYIVSAAASSISGARCQWPYTIHGWT